MILLTALMLAGTNSFNSAFDLKAGLRMIASGVKKVPTLGKAAIAGTVAGYAGYLAYTEIRPALWHWIKKSYDDRSVSASRANKMAQATCYLSGLGLLAWKSGSSCWRNFKSLKA